MLNKVQRNNKTKEKYKDLKQGGTNKPSIESV
jgi:hypothetical protein